MQKLPTIKEIAKRLNVSISTVSRALHDHPSIGLGTRLRVKELAKEINYVPNETAISFQQGKTFTIGVILPKLSEDFFSQAISGIEDVAALNNYSVLVGQSHDECEREQKILESFKKHRVDGLIVSISKETKNITHFLDFARYNIPVVYFDRAPNVASVHKVSCDIYDSSIEIINFLYKRGHRRIALIKGPSLITATNERMKGVIEGLHKKRLKTDPSLFATTDLTKESTWKAMEEILSQKSKPTAVIAFNDYVALDAIQYIKSKTELVINEDICFVSYANLPFCSYLDHPPLASVEQFPYEQGKKAAEIIFSLLQNSKKNYEEVEPLQEVVKCKLVVH